MTGFRIGPLEAGRGQKVQGFLAIGETASGPLRIPLVLVNGREPGPALCLTAGVHATEYAPIDAVMRVSRSLAPDGLRGTVVAVPVANLRMFENRMPFISPLDGLNLNKVGAGSETGSSTEVLAHTLLTDIVGRCQYHIDLHAGDLGEMLLPFVGYALSGNPEQDRMGERLARIYTPGLISISIGQSIPPFSDGICHAASQQGVISLFAESGGNGTLEEEDVRVHLAGIRNVMRELGMIEGGAPAPTGPRTRALGRAVVRASRAGLLRLKVRIGDEIATGQEVAEICDVFGEVVERPRATGSGVAGLVWAHKVVNTGDPIVRYWITEPA